MEDSTGIAWFSPSEAAAGDGSRLLLSNSRTCCEENQQRQEGEPGEQAFHGSSGFGFNGQISVRVLQAEHAVKEFQWQCPHKTLSTDDNVLWPIRPTAS